MLLCKVGERELETLDADRQRMGEVVWGPATRRVECGPASQLVWKQARRVERGDHLAGSARGGDDGGDRVVGALVGRGLGVGDLNLLGELRSRFEIDRSTTSSREAGRNWTARSSQMPAGSR